MAEICPECFNKICNKNYTEKDFILSDELDLCEECGQYKKVVIRVDPIKTKGCLFNIFQIL